MENPIGMDDLGVPHVKKPPYVEMLKIDWTPQNGWCQLNKFGCLLKGSKESESDTRFVGELGTPTSSIPT